MSGSGVGVRRKRPEAGAGRMIEWCALRVTASRLGVRRDAAATWRGLSVAFLAGALGPLIRRPWKGAVLFEGLGAARRGFSGTWASAFV